IKDGLIYIGESSNIYQRYKTHSGTTYFSALRRHIGTDILNFFLKSKNGRKRYFTDSEDSMVDIYLKKCKISYMKINFGRFELEEYLIRKYHPLLNRKENK
ncbi:MAG: GIY-YIG nuclease family protein, partial [Fidelibacterota bacterium]